MADIDLGKLLNIQELNSKLDEMRGKLQGMIPILEKFAQSGADPKAKSTLDEFIRLRNEENKTLKVSLDLHESLNPAEKEWLQNKIAQNNAIRESQTLFKNQAIAMSATAGAYEKMKAESALATQQALNLGAALQMLKNRGNASSEQIKVAADKYNIAAKNAQEMSHQLFQLEQATGKMTARTMGSMPIVGSFSQVLREMPNFAQNARIGFMSLSNNLPMLADDFRRLANSVDDTGKKVGNIGAWKVLAKELIGFNAIVVLATTLLTIYGDDIVKWIGTLFDAADALDSVTEAQKALNAERSNPESGGNKQLEKSKESLYILQDTKSALLELRYGLKSDDATKYWTNANRAINEFKTQFKGVISQGEMKIFDKENLKDINQIDVAINKTTEYMYEYTKAIYNKDAADKKAAESSKKMAEIQAQYDNVIAGLSSPKYSNNKIVQKDLENMKNLRFLDAQSQIFALEQIKTINKDYFTEIKKNLRDVIQLENAVRISRNQSALAYKGTDTKDNNGRKKTGQRTAKTDYEEEYIYSRKIAALKLANFFLEDQKSKETTTGIVNDFQTRFAASESYYNNNKVLIYEEYQRETKVNEQKAQKKEFDLLKDKKYNDDLVAQGKLSSKKRAAANKIIDEALVINRANWDKQIFESVDKRNAKIVENERARAKETMQINKDLYEFEKAEIDKLYYKKKAISDVEYEQRKNDLSAKFDTGKIFGANISGSESISGMALAGDQKVNDLYEKRNQLLAEKSSLIANNLIGTKEYYDKITELENNWTDIEKQSTLNSIELKKAVHDEEIRLKEDVANKSFELAKTLSDSLFQLEQDRLDRESSYQKDIYDEKDKDLEDRKKAGLVTEKEYSDEKDRIAEQSQAVQEDIEERKAELQRKQFLLNQGFAAAQATIQYFSSLAGLSLTEILMAANMASYLGPAAPGVAAAMVEPMRALTTVTYGLTLAGIVAQTIPQFKEGVTNFEGGLAMVNDGGRDEVIIEPNRAPYIPKGRNTILDLPKGTDVIPSLDQYAQLVIDDNTTIQRKIERIAVINNSSNFSDKNIIRELQLMNSQLRMKQSPKDFNKLAKYYRNNTKGIA